MNVYKVIFNDPQRTEFHIVAKDHEKAIRSAQIQLQQRLLYEGTIINAEHLVLSHCSLEIASVVVA